MAVKLPEYTPNRRKQIWPSFVNISCPQWVYGRLFPSNDQIGVWIINIACYILVLQCPQLKSFCWARVLSVWTVRFLPLIEVLSWFSTEAVEHTYLVLWLQWGSYSEHTQPLFPLPYLQLTRGRKRSFAFLQEPYIEAHPAWLQRPSLPHIYHIPEKCQNFLGWKPSKSFLCWLSHFT